MPRGDGTGPQGMGSMTGRGAGFCAGAMPGFRNTGNARGMNKGNGRGGCGGRGFRRMNCVNGFSEEGRFDYPIYYGVNMPVGSEKEFLSKKVKFLENQLQFMKERLNEVGKEAE
ncbi:hypothetical protein UNSWDHB_3021 [Dehalobacter sp. UNSWDHB]|uniref:DUF5320 domain-containing protein n=1 Tax=Dehalobacter sp. UNSWDHB TaxID=1339256 RepID=UPI00038756FD|nr:DUF5320 family protein [Dehalobacter sp. UNSWDHB]EQB22707.1 hypothetical protein UNSWDHB_3021 [Dehalobacter sp. UNSWDHB]